MPARSVTGRVRIARGAVQAARQLAAPERDRPLNDRLAIAAECLDQALERLAERDRLRESALHRPDVDGSHA